MKALASAFLWLAASLSLVAEEPKESASDVFLKAFLAYQRAEKAEVGGLKQQAADHYRTAQQLLKTVSEKHAEWNPAIVAYRVTKVSEGLKRVEEPQKQ